MRTGLFSRSAGVVAVACAAMAASAVSAEPAGGYIQIDGGAYCMLGKKLGGDEGLRLGNEGCGPSARVALGGRASWFGFDAWKIGGRFERTRDEDSVYDATTLSTHQARTREGRTVLDAELSRPMGWSMWSFLGGTSRLGVGLRYESYRLRLNGIEFDPQAVHHTGRMHVSFDGIGPRVAFTSTIPLSTTLRFETETGLAGLFGRMRSGLLDLDGAGGVISDISASRGAFVGNLESTYALTFAPSGHKERGLELSLGVRSEYWFKQARSTSIDPNDASWTRDRNGWTPFLRGTIPLR